jgi:hypothetical protein
MSTPSYPVLRVTNCSCSTNAQPLIDIFEGQTYLKLHAGAAPIGGSFDVIVQPTVPDVSMQELTEMVMMLMASHILRSARAEVA